MLCRKGGNKEDCLLEDNIKVSYQPRMENVPVTIPLPPAPDYGSIFTSQKTGGAKSAF